MIPRLGRGWIVQTEDVNILGGGDLGWSVLDEDIRWGTRRWNEAWFETGRMNGIRHRVVTYK